MQWRILALSPLLLAQVACGHDSTGPYVAPPVLLGAIPSQGTVGTEVRIQGTGFAGDVAVYFGALRAPRVLSQGDALFALAPRGLEPGQKYDVRVVNEEQAADTLVAAFEAVAPRVTRVNGATRPVGLVGMTVLLEGSAFGDSLALAGGQVFFTGPGGVRIPAAVSDPVNDWADSFIVTRVPAGVADTSSLWVETATGTSDTVEFRLIQSGVFSPSTITWTRTTPLPQPLQGLGAVFVAIEDGPAPANYVFTVGGADSQGTPRSLVYRAQVQGTGALGNSWSIPTPLPSPRAYQATAVATAATAPVDTATTAGFLYAIGGLDQDLNAVATVYVGRLDLSGQIDAWQVTTPLPAARYAGGAAIFGGYVYFVGGAGSDGAPVATTYRAAIHVDGSLGAWESLAGLPSPRAYHAMVDFGPYLYAVGGDAGTTTPQNATQTGSELATINLVRLDLRTGGFTADGWLPISAMNKARSKHSTIFGGGALFTTSGIYNGQPGSSENTYASLNSDGTLGSWQGATGSDVIVNALGYSLYNQAAVSFVDASGVAHVLVLGGADRARPGQPSAAVVYY